MTTTTTANKSIFNHNITSEAAGAMIAMAKAVHNIKPTTQVFVCGFEQTDSGVQVSFRYMIQDKTKTVKMIFGSTKPIVESVNTNFVQSYAAYAGGDHE